MRKTCWCSATLSQRRIRPPTRKSRPSSESRAQGTTRRVICGNCLPRPPMRRLGSKTGGLNCRAHRERLPRKRSVMFLGTLIAYRTSSQSHQGTTYLAIKICKCQVSVMLQYLVTTEYAMGYMTYITNPHLPRLRMEAVRLVEQGWGIREVARHLGYSHGAVISWMKKAERMPHNLHAIPTRSSRPRHPRTLPVEMVEKILEYRRMFRPCSRVLKYLLERDGVSVSRSIIERTIQRYHLSRWGEEAPAYVCTQARCGKARDPRADRHHSRRAVRSATLPVYAARRLFALGACFSGRANRHRRQHPVPESRAGKGSLPLPDNPIRPWQRILPEVYNPGPGPRHVPPAQPHSYPERQCPPGTLQPHHPGRVHGKAASEPPRMAEGDPRVFEMVQRKAAAPGFGHAVANGCGYKLLKLIRWV
jgi:transposase